MKPTHSDKSYKEDNERRFNFREEIERIHEDNTKEYNGYSKELSNILKRLDDLADALPGVSSTFRDIDDNMENLRADTDRNTEYTLEFFKAGIHSEKIQKYVERFRNMREDIKDIINAIQDINTGFISEKIQRAFLAQQELQSRTRKSQR